MANRQERDRLALARRIRATGILQFMLISDNCLLCRGFRLGMTKCALGKEYKPGCYLISAPPASESPLQEFE